MASFEKKIAGFLDSAVSRKIIDRQVANNLLSFANSEDFEHKGWFSLSHAMGILGALALAFGVILIIATNWWMFSDIAKISGFITLMGSCHFTGLYLAKNGYEKVAVSLHLLGAGLFIAGIGLMAQIFNLSSQTGESFLIWAVMIAPLAVLLRSGLVALLSIFAFSLWGDTYLDYLFSYRAFPSIMAFNAAIALSSALGGVLLKKKASDIAPYLQAAGMIGLVGFLYLFGFYHNFGYSDFKVGSGALISFIAIIPAIVILAYLFISGGNNTKTDRYFLLTMLCAFFTITLAIILPVIGVNKDSYIRYISFGWTQEKYTLPLIISVFAWVSYFVFAFWGVIHGALSHDRWLLNSSVFLVGLGIFTRFIDLIGNMFDTGIMFILCGILLFVVGYRLEKWRRKLIEQAKENIALSV
ncbi:MAG: DUF2157 domain-containing protein [Rickettsiales bacterium]